MSRHILRCICVVLVLLIPSILLAANPNEFQAGFYTESESGLELPYRLFEPLDYDPANEYPLVLFLHGAGESGTDNTAQVNGNIDNLLSHLKMPEYSAFLLAPQTNTGWTNWSSDNLSNSMQMTMSVIDQLKTTYNIDPSRLYITGLSMGGFGTWDTIWKEPGTFAAAVPICGGGDTTKAPLMVDQPIWNFHNADDGTVSVEWSREMIAAVEAAGGNPLYTEYSSGGHNAWSRAYNESELYGWMFSQPVGSAPGMMATNPDDGSILDIGLVRVDSTGTKPLTATNIGDLETDLSGTFPAASGEFGPDTPSWFSHIESEESVSRPYTYTPTSRGTDTLSMTVTSYGGDSTITLSGTGVGPVLGSNLDPDSTLDFDLIEMGTPQSFFLDISNITPDENNGDNSLTDLTLLSVSITGSHPDLFDIVDFTPGTVLHKDDLLSFEISYNGTGEPGYKNAMLNIYTDEDAALGAAGSIISIDILATLLDNEPEPGLGYASAYVAEDGSIILNTTEPIAYYEIFLGDWFHEYTYDQDFLSLDTDLTMPNWIFPFSGHQDRVDGHSDENFSEFLSVDYLVANEFDTGVNVDSLPTGVFLWLQYQKAGEEAYFVKVPLAAVPEPGSIVLAISGILGLLAFGWRGRSH